MAMSRCRHLLYSGKLGLAAALTISILLHMIIGAFPFPGAGPVSGAGSVPAFRLDAHLRRVTWQVQPDGPLSPAEKHFISAPELNAGQVGSGNGRKAPSGFMDYLDARFLTAQPYPLKDIDVAFPSEMVPQDGKVKVEILIEPDGRASRVSTIHSELPEAYANEAVQAFSDQLFVPGRLHERPVRSRLVIEVVFDTSGLF